MLDSETVVKNWAVIRDEVYSVSRGFVTQYEVIKDERKNDDWVIEIDAEVATGKIKDKLADLRILHQKMGNKRLMVIYQPTHPDAFPADHSAVLSALISIPDTFSKSGFRIFEQTVTDYISKKTSQTGAEKADWKEIIDEQQADFVIEFELVGEGRKIYSSSSFSAARVDIRMKAFDVSTGRLISNVQTQQKQMTNARVGSYDWDNALSKAGEKAGTEATRETIENVIDFYESVGDIGNSYLIIFNDFSEDEEDAILEILENLEGFQSLSELQNTPTTIELEYFSSIGKSRLRRLIRIETKAKRIRVSSKDISGNRLIFIKQ